MGATKQDDFDFDLAEDLTKEEEPTKKKALSKKDLEKEVGKLKKQIATSGSPTPAIIAEARKLAESPRGMNIDKFMAKHKLFNINIEQLLNAPLDKEGNYA